MGTVIHGTYEIVRELGSGGGGVVYLAEHLNLHKRVVLKADKRNITTSPDLLRREVDVLKELHCVYIPQVYDFFVENDKVYTAMEYIAGESLDQPLERGEHFSQPQVIAWAKQLLEALDYLHTPRHGDPPKGFVHSDIKPANLMRTPDNSICLIDFNIALALGEEHHIGLSEGYASPEHYGLDYSGLIPEGTVSGTKKRTMSLFREKRTSSAKTAGNAPGAAVSGSPGTQIMPPAGSPGTQVMPPAGSPGMQVTPPPSRKIIPDVRSDIYMVGATLYHLLSGQRPDKDFQKIVPLSSEQFSAPLAEIIQKAMQPNPDLRFQTAAEMLAALNALHFTDKRWIRLKRQRRAGNIAFACLALAGAFMGYTGSARLTKRAEWETQILAAREDLAQGKRQDALSAAMRAIPEQPSLFVPGTLPAAQEVLTEALGTYDLAGSYRGEMRVQLPSELLAAAIAPDGKHAVCLYAFHMAVVDMQTGEICFTLPAAGSALAEAEFLDADRLVFAGEDGLTCVDVRTGETVWQGEKATAIAISADKSKIAAVWRDATQAKLYDASDGTLCGEISFGDNVQPVAGNDIFADPHDAMLALNADGTMLAASFSDGSVVLFSCQDGERLAAPIEANEWYTHFEGGFAGKYLVFSASMGNSVWQEDSNIIAWLDTESGELTGETYPEPCGVRAAQQGCYVQKGSLLAAFAQGELVPLLHTEGQIWQFDSDGKHTLLSTREMFAFYHENGGEMSHTSTDTRPDILAIAGGYALVGSMDSADVRILHYTEHPDVDTYQYDVNDSHLEARLTQDGETLMLFDHREFSIYQKDGTLTVQKEIPDADTVYDQQFCREDNAAFLEVTYYDGRRTRYDARSGEELETVQGEVPDSSLDETLETDRYRIFSPLHGEPTVYDKNTGKKLCTLQEDAYLTYATEIGGHLAVQYITADGYRYGQLLDSHFSVIAQLPYLCDVTEDRLVFDYPAGYVRSSPVYTLPQLMAEAKKGVK